MEGASRAAEQEGGEASQGFVPKASIRRSLRSITLRRWLRKKRWVSLLRERFFDLHVVIGCLVLWLFGLALMGSLVLVLYLVGMVLI